MPKIKTLKLNIKTKRSDLDVQANLMYNSTEGFYVKIPDMYLANVKGISKDNAAKYGLDVHGQTARRKAQEPIVRSSSENGAVDNFSQIMKMLIDLTSSKRDVIILFFTAERPTHYNSHHYNKEHQQLAMKIGLTYAVETTIGISKTYTLPTDKQYGSVQVRGANPERLTMTLWNQASTIIDDTPENREFLEGLYNNYKHLREQLTKFTETDTALIGLISGNTKLLGNG